MSDDLTIAYMMGVEDMRSRLHKQADEIERLRAELKEITKHRDALWGEHSNEPADRYWETRWRDEAAENYDLLAENEKLRAAFRVNMLRAFPHMSHDEIDAEIAAAIRESRE